MLLGQLVIGMPHAPPCGELRRLPKAAIAMRHLVLLATAIVCGLPLHAVAGPHCPVNQTTVFACTTTNNKQVLVCDAGSTLSYHFGRPRQTPELSLSIPRQQASTWQWHGIGRSIDYSVTLPNGNTQYTVYTSVDRLADVIEREAGVAVLVDGMPRARILCRTDSIVESLVAIELQPTTFD